MNIVLYVNSFLPKIGGRELVVHHLARALQRLGHRVRVLGATGWWRNRHLVLEYPVHRYPGLGGLLNEPVRRSHLLADVSLRGADVIHAHATYPAGYVANAVKRTRPTPVVITPHGQDIHIIPQLGHGLRLNPRIRPKITQALQEAEACTAISAGVEASLLEAGALPDQLFRVGNGVDVERFATPPALDVRARFGLPAEAPLLVAVGNYNPRKGHEELLRAMPRILAQRPDARLVIVGRKTEALRPLIAELGLAQVVVLTGALPVPVTPRDEDPLAALYGAATVYLSGATDEGSEGLSLALLEAMAAGVPGVVTSVSGSRDVVRDGRNGLLVPPGRGGALADAVLRVLNEPGLHERLAGGARASAAAYHWDAVAAEYVKVYEFARVRMEQRMRRRA